MNELQLWHIVGASAPGLGHLQATPPLPCQDSYTYDLIDADWGVVVVCDGAGSKENSQFGSQFISKSACKLFKQIVIENNWHTNRILPSESQWFEVSVKGLSKLRLDLEKYAIKNNYDPISLSCTVIITIVSPFGVLVVHIGDGRAAFRNTQNRWKALMTPWKSESEEKNVTVFLTSPIWDKPEDFIESKVISEKINAFAVLTDGVEKYAFKTYLFDETINKVRDFNEPFSPFLNSVIQSLHTMYKEKNTKKLIEEKWHNFLANHKNGLKNELDDKTMVIGGLW